MQPGQRGQTLNTNTTGCKSGVWLTIGHAACQTQRWKGVCKTVQWAWLLVQYSTGLPEGLQELGRWTGSPVQQPWPFVPLPHL